MYYSAKGLWSGILKLKNWAVNLQQFSSCINFHNRPGTRIPASWKALLCKKRKRKLLLSECVSCQSSTRKLKFHLIVPNQLLEEDKGRSYTMTLVQTTGQQYSCLASAAFPGGSRSPIGPNPYGTRHIQLDNGISFQQSTRDSDSCFPPTQSQWNIYYIYWDGTFHAMEKMQNRRDGKTSMLLYVKVTQKSL